MSWTLQTWVRYGLVIGVSAVCLALLGWVVWNQMRARQPIDGALQRETLQRVETVKQTCAQAQNPELCEQEVVLNGARTLGDVEVCTRLEGEAFSACVRLLALDQGDADLCHVLAGEEESGCRDTTFSAQAQQQGELALCERVHDKGKRQQCQEAVQAVLVSRGSCGLVAELDTALCEQSSIARRALATLDVNLCAQLDTEEARIGCQDDVQEARANVADDPGIDTDGDGLEDDEELRRGTSPQVADSDADGLTDGEEVQTYHTDPLDPDSDADGYLDGEEVRNGYTPLGAGQL